MSKFFDISKKVLYFTNIVLVSLFFFVPTVPTSATSKEPLVASFLQGLPQMNSTFAELFADTSVPSVFKERTLARSIFLIIFFFITLATLIHSIATFLRKKRYCLFPFLLSASLFFLCYCVAYSYFLDDNGVMILSYRYIAYPNATAVFILFFLYIIYLLLRRYYAPVKARILASRAERQANRKPTKDERIAELERKVAELESKNKDEQ